jgi:hypothetical protein
LPQSEWVVRGITRDTSKVAARQWSDRGVDIVVGDIDDVPTIAKAFKGANVAFGTTDFVQHLQDPQLIARAERESRPINELATERESEQAKRMIDAAAANVDSLDLFILSTLSDAKGLSKGKIQYNLHFDSKWTAVEYLKDRYPALWAKTSLLQLGIFMSNWKVPFYAPQKQQDGTFKLMLPMSGSKRFPVVDPNADTGELSHIYHIRLECISTNDQTLGRLVQALIEREPGIHLVGAASMSSWDEWCRVWSKVNNVDCRFERLDRKVFEDTMGSVGREFADMFQVSGPPCFARPFLTCLHSTWKTSITTGVMPTQFVRGIWGLMSRLLLLKTICEDKTSLRSCRGRSEQFLAAIG